MERFVHKGAVLFVEPDREDRFYLFRFVLNKKTVRRRTKTRLRGMAIRRARRAIDRALREQPGGKATRGFFLSPVDRIARTQPLMGKTVGGPRRRELHAVIPRNDIASAVR